MKSSIHPVEDINHGSVNSMQRGSSFQSANSCRLNTSPTFTLINCYLIKRLKDIR